MKNKKLYFGLIIIFILFIYLFFSCQKNDIKYSDIAYFAEPIIQDFCAGFTTDDYTNFAQTFSNYLSKPIPAENLAILFTNIGNKIGKYVPQTVSYKSIKKIKNIYIVSYTASFTEETEPVNITLNFEKVFNEFKLAGFSVDSPKLRNEK